MLPEYKAPKAFCPAALAELVKSVGSDPLLPGEFMPFVAPFKPGHGDWNMSWPPPELKLGSKIPVYWTIADWPDATVVCTAPGPWLGASVDRPVHMHWMSGLKLTCCWNGVLLSTYTLLKNGESP